MQNVLLNVLLGAPVAAIIGWNVHLFFDEWPIGTEKKWDIFRNENEHLRCLAGEAHPEAWTLIAKIIRDKIRTFPNICYDIICGPLAQMELKFCEWLPCSPDECRELMRTEHPVFKLLSEHPQQIHLYLKKVTAPRERHYAVGLYTKREIYQEIHHGEKTFRGGNHYDTESFRGEEFILAKEAEHIGFLKDTSNCRRISIEQLMSDDFLRPRFPFHDQEAKPRALFAEAQ